MANERDNVVEILAPCRDAEGEAGLRFEDFVRSHYRVLVDYLRGSTVSSEQDAEDIAQESLARLLRYRESEPARAWKPLLFRIAINLAHDHLRQMQRHLYKAHVSLEAQDLPALGESNEPTPEECLAYQHQLALVLAAIRNLPDKCRHVFLLSRFHGMSNHAIALRYGISVRMVEKQITKALAACRDRVRDHVV